MTHSTSIVFLDASTLDRGDMDFGRFTSEWDCRFHAVTNKDETAARIAGCAIAVTNKVVFDAELLARPEAAALKLIAVAATGTNNVDLEAAAARGIAVCNVAGYSTNSVAQHTFGFILELATSNGRFGRDVREGLWEKSPTFTMLTHPIVELAGKTHGIVGYGNIGRAVGAISKAFGMNVIAAKLKSAGADSDVERVPLDELLGRADIVSLHCPLSPETRNLIDARALGLMKPTAFIVNMARGGVVDETALIDALREKRIAGAATDVLTQEPPQPRHPMADAAREFDNLLLTPHTAWSSHEARARLLNEIAENIAAFLQGESRNRVA